jgi:hypothetical protein
MRYIHTTTLSVKNYYLCRFFSHAVHNSALYLELGTAFRHHGSMAQPFYPCETPRAVVCLIPTTSRHYIHDAIELHQDLMLPTLAIYWYHR